jgi:hypothetical protein
MLSAHLHWEDDIGSPRISVDDQSRIVSVWAMLDVEVRNTSDRPIRVSDLYMEVRTTRFPRRLIATADPRAIGQTRDWYKMKNPRRVEWLLEPHSAGQRQNVDFQQGYPTNGGPVAPKRVTITIVAELEGGKKTVRLYLEDDVLAPTKEPGRVYVA